MNNTTTTQTKQKPRTIQYFAGFRKAELAAALSNGIIDCLFDNTNGRMLYRVSA